MFKLSKKSQLSVELRDYVLRALVKKGPSAAQWDVIEIPLERDVVNDSIVNDEMALFNVLKENLPRFGGKNQNVRMFVPDATVLLKKFHHPEEYDPKKLKEYVMMELGQSIHLPFQEPLIDVYDAKEGDGEATLFAVPPDEVQKLLGLFLDLNLTPEAADVRALCNLRLLEHLDLLDDERTYLISDWSINELSISIYSGGALEFLRFQSLQTEVGKWRSVELSQDNYQFSYAGDLAEYQMVVSDQVLELERMMNFFKFSLHKGEKNVDEVIVMGDNPILDYVASYLQDNLATPVSIVNDDVIAKAFPSKGAKHAAILGLALKEVKG